jgi:hypothetical protein
LQLQQPFAQLHEPVFAAENRAFADEIWALAVGKSFQLRSSCLLVEGDAHFFSFCFSARATTR